MVREPLSRMSGLLETLCQGDVVDSPDQVQATALKAIVGRL